MKIKSLVLSAALLTPTVVLAQGVASPRGTPGSTAGTAGAPRAAPPRTSDTTISAGSPSSGKTTKLASDDVALVAHLHHANMLEIDMGKLAKRSGGAAVKRLGMRLIKDHQTSDKQLIAFAKKRGVARIPTMPLDTEAARKEHDASATTMVRLEALKGGEFDREFLLSMVGDHDRELGRLDIATAAAHDPDLQSFLRDVRPVLERHADAARELQHSADAVSMSGTTASEATRGGATKAGKRGATSTTPRPSDTGASTPGAGSGSAGATPRAR